MSPLQDDDVFYVQRDEDAHKVSWKNLVEKMKEELGLRSNDEEEE